MEPWFRFAVIVIKPLLLLLTRRDFRGQQNVPAAGGCIVAVNHISYADPFVVAMFIHDLGRRPRYLAKSPLFRMFLVRSVLKGAKQIPVYRETSDAGHALSAAVAAVKSGECLVIYPEGTVTRDPAGWPMLAKTGVARLALMTGAPVIPMGQWGAQDLWPYQGRIRPFPRKRVRVLAGEPVDLTKWAGAEPTAVNLRAITDHVMDEVSALIGELRGEAPPTDYYVPDATRGETRRSA